MDFARRIGIGIVMIVPTFVGAGAVWAIFSHWLPVALWVIIMALLSGAVTSGRLSRS
jgi:hypothetical protein